MKEKIKEKNIEVTVRLVFSIEAPEAMGTPDKILAEHLVNKLLLDAKWAQIRSREIVQGRSQGVQAHTPQG
ncbi:MAG: hypothetical protein K8I29_16135 [Alphaproteobacteria bacterium]|uniref:Uncharacterized protein n=1 Tax=Candidatus Nitrobium versatile TaxID=2884831 RepID=A0A953M2G7_9BACT|nr:hypothetical protein [Candidatus Nitrobium versatile]